jgi:alkylation response protein AidB-like acyl-CoA dehydrogenase
VVGAVNAGWAVAMTLLGYERGEAAATFPIMFRAELDRLFDLARETGRSKPTRIRQRLAWCYSKVEIMRYLGMRTLTKFLAGAQPGPAESSFKLYWSEYHQVRHRAGCRHPRRRGSDADRARRRVASRPTTWARPMTALLDQRLPHEPGRHDLRRHVPGAAQHHRRDGPRPCPRNLPAARQELA